MEAEQPVPDADLVRIRRQLVSSGRARGLSQEDAEDRAQDALLRLVREPPRRNGPPVAVRAAQALKLAVIDDWRRETRRTAIPRSAMTTLDTPRAQQVHSPENVERRLRFMETVREVTEIVGHDAMQLLLEGQAGYTQDESVSRHRPGSPTTGALRKRIARALPEIAAILNDLKGQT